jgi:hypothetical protein
MTLPARARPYAVWVEETVRRKGRAVYNFDYLLATAYAVAWEVTKLSEITGTNHVRESRAALLTAPESVRTLAAFLFQTFIIFNSLSLDL